MANFYDYETCDDPTRSVVTPPPDPTGDGLPSGGSMGQVLTLGTDGKPVWATPSGGGGAPLVVDSTLSTTSTNPVRNSAVAAAVSNLSQEIALKAPQSAVDALEETVAGKASQASVTALQTAVEGKADASALAGYVLKETGKGLSTNDFTDEEKTKLAGLSNYAGEGGSAELTSDLSVSKAVGGIASGKTYAKGTDVETILRDMLNPVENPTFTSPSATLSASGSKLLEAGSTANVTFMVAFNRGTITPAYGTSGNRAGAATGYSLNGGAEQTSNSFTETVSESNRTFSAVVKYAAGEQPKNSAGQDYSAPLPAGQVTSNTVSYEFVDAIWSNAGNIGTIAKEALLSKSAGQKVFNFPAQGAAGWETFDIPATWNVTAVEVLNTLSNQYQDCRSEFTVTDVTHGSVAYKRYTYSTGIATGARTVRVQWN